MECHDLIQCHFLSLMDSDPMVLYPCMSNVFLRPQCLRRNECGPIHLCMVMSHHNVHGLDAPVSLYTGLVSVNLVKSQVEFRELDF